MTTPQKIQEALKSVMGEVQAVSKDSRNTHQNFSFRGIDAVVNAVGPALRKYGVIVLPEVLEHQHDVIEVGNNRSRMRWVLVTVAYTFVGPDGDSLRSVSVGEAMDSGDKATPKAMSVAFRTALLQALCIPTDEPDPDAASPVMGPAPTPPPTAAADKKRTIGLLTELGVDDPTGTAAKVWADNLPGRNTPLTDDEWAWLEDSVRSNFGGEP